MDFPAFSNAMRLLHYVGPRAVSARHACPAREAFSPLYRARARPHVSTCFSLFFFLLLSAFARARARGAALLIAENSPGMSASSTGSLYIGGNRHVAAMHVRVKNSRTRV